MDCQEFSRGSARGLPRHGLADLVSFDLRLRARGSLGSPQVGPGVRIRASVRSREKRRAAGTSTRNAEHASAWRPAAAWQLGCCFQCRLEKGVQARPMGTAAAAARKLACVMTQLTTNIEGAYCSADGTWNTACCEGQSPTSATTLASLLLGAPVSCSTVHSQEDCQAACTATYASPSNQYRSLPIGGVVQMDCSQDGTAEPSCCVDDSSSKPSSFTGGTTTTLVSLYRRLRPSANLLQT